jgi:hypothetical protein
MNDNKSLERAMLEKLLAERDELDQHIAFLRKRLEAAEAGDLAEQIPPEYSSTIKPDELALYSRPQAAIAILRKVRKNLSTNEIFEFLKRGGQDMSGKNAFNALYTALSRTPDIRKVAPNTWGLAEWVRPVRVPPPPPKPDDDDSIPF